ncbi:MAG: metallophosphoesterase [Ilumatobacteraceae bacterium]
MDADHTDHTGAEGSIRTLHKLRRLPFEPQPPVRWLDPRVLVHTGLQLVLSGVFERFADKREYLGGIPAPPVAAPGTDTEDVWVDYVSDVGDGFDATATIAWMLAQEQLVVDDEGALPRGSVVVLGGDQVYPFASLEEYENRTLGPYRAMLPHTDAPHPLLLAIPGNHDWYDGLTAFMRVFAQARPEPTAAAHARAFDEEAPVAPAPAPTAGRWIGGWMTAQRRSYFSVQVRAGWWLWGLDIQLDTYIDAPQMEYFNAEAQRLRPDDGVILCCARPGWLHCGPGDPESYSVLDFFERTFIRPTGANLRLTLTGDHHSYARYVGDDGEQKIIAGGGGAYLDWGHHFRPTLDLPPAESRDRGKTDQRPFRLVPSSLYPSAEVSRREAGKFWRVLWRNGPFLPLMVACMYGLWALLIPDPVDVWSPRFVAPCVVAVLMLIGLTHEKTLLSKGVAVLHAAAHLGAVLGLSWVFEQWVDRPWTWLLVGAAGAAVGPLLLGLYLRLADMIEINAGELFAAQRLETYKCFLRLRITPDGDLTIYPIGVREVFHRWRLLPEAPDSPPIAPAGVDPTPWHLIEPPIVITRTPTTTTGAP